MKTTLPVAITSVEEAKAFLTELHSNGEHYHPEDDAHTIEWPNCDMVITNGECEQLNTLMGEIYMLPGNDGRHCEPMIFDPCEFLNGLDGITLDDDDKDLNIDDLINPDEDDRIFTADDMVQFAFVMVTHSHLNHDLTIGDMMNYIKRQVDFEAGDGSYETYKMPERP